MAKKKRKKNVKVDLEEDVLLEEEEIQVDDDDAGAATLDADDDEAVELGEDSADDDDKDKDDDKVEEEEKPTAKNTALTLVLCVLNVLAACGFVFCLFLNAQFRYPVIESAFLYGLRFEGLPLAEEDKNSAFSPTFQPVVEIRPEEAKTAAGKRAVNVPEKFQIFKGTLNLQIRPEQMDNPDLQRKYFGAGEPVKTLEEELKRVQAKLHETIDGAAQDTAKKADTDDKRRQLIARMLLPLSHTTEQIEQLAAKIEAAGDGELKTLAVDAVQRRLYLDLLHALQKFRPWGRNKAAKAAADAAPDPAAAGNPNPPVTVDPKLADEEAADYRLVDQGVDFKTVPLAKLKELLDKRFEMALAPETYDGFTQVAFEKRAVISFLLTAASFLQHPESQLLLLPDQAERTELVVGVVQYATAVNALAAALKGMSAEWERKAFEDREGGISYEMVNNVKVGTKINNFHDRHKIWLNQLAAVVREIKDHEFRLNTLQLQLATTKAEHDTRKVYYNEVVTQLLDERKRTADLAKVLATLEHDLFEIQRQSAEATESNLLLIDEIRNLEKTLEALENQ
jgi:hypothetical protein